MPPPALVRHLAVTSAAGYLLFLAVVLHKLPEGLAIASLFLAWVVQGLGLWLQAAILGAEPGFGMIAAVALVDLLRYSLYILVFAVIVQAVLSWVNPYTPLAPAFDTITRPFLRPLRRYVPAVGNVDLTPLILLVILYVVLIVVNHLRVAAATV